MQHQIQYHQQGNTFQPLIMQQSQQNNETPISSPSGQQTPQQQQTPSSQQHTPNSSNMLNQLLPGLQLPGFQLPQLFNFGSLSSAFPFGSTGNEMDMARMAQQLGAANGRLPTMANSQTPVNTN